MSDTSSRKDLGLTCVNCGQVNMGPNRELDNWQCGYCYSGFLSMKMLNNLVPREVLSQFNHKYQPETPKRAARPCANCERAMEWRASTVGSGRHVEVEMCAHCRLIWFDSGDLLRTLRAKKPDEVYTKEDVISQGAERKTDRVLREEGANVWATDDYFPRQTVYLLLVAALMMPFVTQYPDLSTFLGLSPARPFHLLGATWLTSFFFHHHYFDFLSTGLWLLFVGAFVEQKMGVGKYLRLFVVAGLVARFQYLIGGTFRDPVFIGLKASVLAVTAYALCSFPYQRVFFPNTHKWRTPREKIVLVLVISFAACLLLVALDFMLEVIRLRGTGAVGSNLQDLALSNTLWGKAGRYFGDNLFRSHSAGFIVGLIWYMGEPTRKNPPPS